MEEGATKQMTIVHAFAHPSRLSWRTANVRTRKNKLEIKMNARNIRCNVLFQKTGFNLSLSRIYFSF